MKANSLLLLVAALSLHAAPHLVAAPLTTAFTYQGRLNDGAAQASGSYDFRFALYNAAVGGSQMGDILTTDNLTVAGGVFTTSLDFGAVFDGSHRWIEIAVRPGASLADFTVLTPRQPVTAAPYALYALTPAGPAGTQGPKGDKGDAGLTGAPGSLGPAGAAGTAGPKGATGSSGPAGAVGPAGAQGVRGVPGPVGPAGPAGSTGPAGAAGQQGPQGPAGSLDAWGRLGNTGTTAGVNFFGTTDDQALEFKVHGIRALRLEPTPGNIDHLGLVNVVGGSPANFVGANVYGATIAGGGAATYLGGSGSNKVTADLGTVGGGVANTASGSNATVGGGFGNTAIGDFATVGGGRRNTSSDYSATVGGGTANTSSGVVATVGGGQGNISSGGVATVGGGIDNSSSGDNATVGGGQGNTSSGSSATVGGGFYNEAIGDYSTVPGGRNNTSSGEYATVPGGLGNSAGGRYSFAAGYSAKANHDGSFVWSMRDSPAPSFAASRFHINAYNGLSVDYDVQRADGGGSKWIVIGGTGAQAISTSTGAWLSDEGVWNNRSDRNAKTDFTDVNTREILEKVAALPIQVWRYTNGLPTVRHLGPVAQDFHAAFGLGPDEKSIGTVDADGVALAAIQGLNLKLGEQNAAQEVASRSKDARIAALERRLEALEKVLSAAPEKVRRQPASLAGDP